MKKYLIVLALIVLVISGVAYWKLNKSVDDIQACTKEAKICPDGSTVERVGLNCEFAECPAVNQSTSTDETADWQTYRNDKYGFEFKYPNDWKFSDYSYTYKYANQKNSQQIGFWVSAPARIIPQSNGIPVSFYMKICKVNDKFTSYCDQDGEVVQFHYPYKNDGSPDLMEGTSDFITTVPEYAIAHKILESAK